MMLMFDDTATLLRMLRGQRTGGTHAERLQAFYQPQASHYDAFRARLLTGRAELVGLLGPMAGDRIVELGGGTGANLAWFGNRLNQLESYDLVDLCPALLDIARQRPDLPDNVNIIEADAATWRPPAPVDAVYFSYSLTMMPDWEAALDNALAMLKPGGKLGVVDFHLPDDAGTVARWFWRHWFAHDGVHLSGARLAALQQRLRPVHCIERFARLPYVSAWLPWMRVPCFLFVGCKT